MIASLAATPMRARAAGTRAVGPTPPRLAFIEGEVSFWRPGAEDWTPAKINTPLAVGDSLYARDGANLEMQIGPRAVVRAGSNAEIGIETSNSDSSRASEMAALTHRPFAGRAFVTNQ